jgi:hypothetical protein
MSRTFYSQPTPNRFRTRLIYSQLQWPIFVMGIEFARCATVVTEPPAGNEGHSIFSRRFGTYDCYNSGIPR